MIQKIYNAVALCVLSLGLWLALPSAITAAEQKRIEIDLSSQRLYAYEGDTVKYSFVISSGKPWWPTPTGMFQPWIKLPYDRMRGGSTLNGTYYDLPNVPYVMYFFNSQTPKWRGYAIHGTYWHNNFGFPMSHGCINLKTEDAKVLYSWTDLPSDTNTGTDIRIYGSTPK